MRRNFFKKVCDAWRLTFSLDQQNHLKRITNAKGFALCQQLHQYRHFYKKAHFENFPVYVFLREINEKKFQLETCLNKRRRPAKRSAILQFRIEISRWLIIKIIQSRGLGNFFKRFGFRQIFRGYIFISHRYVSIAQIIPVLRDVTSLQIYTCKQT